MMVMVMPAMMISVTVPAADVHDHRRSRIYIHDATRRRVDIYNPRRRPRHNNCFNRRRARHHGHRLNLMIHRAASVAVDNGAHHGTRCRTDDRALRPAITVVPADQSTRNRTDNRRVANDRRTIMFRLCGAHRSRRKRQGNKDCFHGRAKRRHCSQAITQKFFEGKKRDGNYFRNTRSLAGVLLAPY